MAFSRTYGNPAHPAYLADPFVFRHEGVYYAVGTGAASTRHPSGLIFSTLRSDDFIVWEAMGGALVQPDPALGTDCWAPEVAYADGQFFLYYSVGFEDRGHQLRVATSANPLGPYQDLGEPVLDPRSCPFAIDASPYRDDDGRWYLFYARDFLDTARPGTSLVMAPLEDMRRIGTDFVTVARASHDWQRYQAQRPIYGGVYDWHTLEGPCVTKHYGRYFCLYSGGNWQNDTYGLDYVSADRIDGPYLDDNPGDGPRVLRTVPSLVIGPGHNSLVVGPNETTQYVAYHAWDAQKVARRLCFDVLDWTPNGPRCLGPTWEPKVVDW